MNSYLSRFHNNGYSKTISQVIVTVLFMTLLFGYGLADREKAVMTFGEDTETGVSLPILMYHSLLKDSAMQGRYILSPAQFRGDMDYLKKNGYETVVIADLIAFVENGMPLPEKPVMITFDDGYYNNYVYAYPILKEFGMKAVLSVIGSETAHFSETGQENPYWSYLTYERLRQIEDVFEIQNHSWGLHTMKGRRGCLRRKGEEKDMYRSFFVEDALETQRNLIENGIKTPTCYTYPFGARNEETDELIQELGFMSTMGCKEGINIISRNPESLFALKRFNRSSGISTAQFMNKVGI